jgi:hypothetical protein
MTNFLEGLSLPLHYSGGVIKDGSGQTILEANRETGKTPLSPAGRDMLLKIVCELLNESFEHDQINQLIKKLK